jgi:hypothetical protein
MAMYSQELSDRQARLGLAADQQIQGLETLSFLHISLGFE